MKRPEVIENENYVTFFSLRVAFQEGAAILAGYVRFHGYFSFFIRITAYLLFLPLS